METYRDWINRCLELPEAVEDYPFDDTVAVIKVRGKMFALVPITEQAISISLKCDPHLALSYRQQYIEVTPGYHLNKTHWNTIQINGNVPEAELIWMIRHSYELVVKGLTKKDREGLL